MATAPVYAADRCEAVFTSVLTVTPESQNETMAEQGTALPSQQQIMDVLKKMQEAWRAKNPDAYSSLAMASLKYIQAVMASHGTKFKIVHSPYDDRHPVLLILPDSSSPSRLNKLAAQIQRRFSYDMIIDPVMRVQEGSLGYASETHSLMAISIEDALADKAGSVTLHETRHVYLNWLRDRALAEGLGESLSTAWIRPGHKELRMSSYTSGFRIDEMLAHTMNLLSDSADMRQAMHWDDDIRHLEQDILSREKAITRLQNQYDRAVSGIFSKGLQLLGMTETVQKKQDSLQNQIQSLLEINAQKQQLVEDLQNGKAQLQNSSPENLGPDFPRYIQRIGEMAGVLEEVGSVWRIMEDPDYLTVYADTSRSKGEKLNIYYKHNADFKVRMIKRENRDIVVMTATHTNQYYDSPTAAVEFEITDPEFVQWTKDSIQKEETSAEFRKDQNRWLPLFKKYSTVLKVYESFSHEVQESLKVVKKAQTDKDREALRQGLQRLREGLLGLYYPLQNL